MRNNIPIKEPYVGMRIKVKLPTMWCQIHSDSPYHLMKGKVIEMPNEKTIVISIWSKKCGKIDRMMCFKSLNGYFNNIFKQL